SRRRRRRWTHRGRRHTGGCGPGGRKPHGRRAQGHPGRHRRARGGPSMDRSLGAAGRGRCDAQQPGQRRQACQGRAWRGRPTDGRPHPQVRDSAEIALDAFLILFAADAERRLGAGLEALERDFLAALLAVAEAAVLDAVERLLNLVQEDLLAAAQTEGERLQVLAGRQVHLIGQVVLIEGHVLGERLLCALEDFLTFLLEQILELLEMRLVHHGALVVAASDGRRSGASVRVRPGRKLLNISLAPGSVNWRAAQARSGCPEFRPKREAGGESAGAGSLVLARWCWLAGAGSLVLAR